MGFRTIHDHVDVSEVAGSFGGGGHEKAAGCSLTEEAYKQFVAKTYPLEPLREDARRNRFNQKQSTFGTLYKSKTDEFLFLYPLSNQAWAYEKNRQKQQTKFSSFEEGEKFLKRNYEAWLIRDEIFVQYLVDEVKRQRGKENK